MGRSSPPTCAWRRRGCKPHTEFVVGSGIVADWGIQVDDRLRTSVPGWWRPGTWPRRRRMTGERYVHAIFPNAVAQAPDRRGEPARCRSALRGRRGHEQPQAPRRAHRGHRHDRTIPTRCCAGSTARDLRSVYLRDDRVVGAQLAGDIRAAGSTARCMLRRTPVGRFGQRLVEPRFGMADSSPTRWHTGPPPDQARRPSAKPCAVVVANVTTGHHAALGACPA